MSKGVPVVPRQGMSNYALISLYFVLYHSKDQCDMVIIIYKPGIFPFTPPDVHMVLLHASSSFFM